MQFFQDNGDHQSKLFGASQRLLDMQPDKNLPPYTNKTDSLAVVNEIGEFFVHKITSVRSKLTTGDQHPVECRDTSDVCIADITLSEFLLLSEDNIRKLISANREIVRTRPNSSVYSISVPGLVTPSNNSNG